MIMMMVESKGGEGEEGKGEDLCGVVTPKVEYVLGRASLSASTCGGVRGDELRSGLQKAIRRGDERVAWAAAGALLLLGTSGAGGGKAEAQAAAKILTNLLNRLGVILVEDVGLAAPEIPPRALALLREVRKRHSANALSELVRMLCKAPKVRLLSDWGIMWKYHKFRYASVHPEYGPAYFGRYEAEPQRLEEECRKAGVTHLRSRISVWLRMEVIPTEPGLRKPIARLVDLMLLEDPLALHYAMRDFVCSDKLLSRAFRGRKRRIYLLFALAEEAVRLAAQLERQTEDWSGEIRALDDLYRDHSSHKEAYLLALNAVLCVVYRKSLVSACGWTGEARREEVVEYPPSEPPVLPDWARDKHTARGRRNGKSSTDFALEGAVVANEAEGLVEPELRELYQRMALSEGPSVNLENPWVGKMVKCPTYPAQLRPLPDAMEGVEENDREDVGRVEEEEEERVAVPRRKRKRERKEEKVEASERGGKKKKSAGEEEAPARLESKFVKPEAVRRIQVVVRKSGADVYSDGKGRIVKGPYRSEEDLQFQLRINNHWKFMFRGVRPTSRMHVEWLVPDLQGLGNPEGFGFRTQVEPGRAYPFLVMEDLCWEEGQAPYPVRLYGKRGGKWAPETPLADRKGCAVRELDLHTLPGTAQKSLILALLFRYVWGIRDTCARNILVDHSSGAVFSIDEELGGPEGKAPSSLFKKPLTGAKRMVMEQIVSNLDWVHLTQNYLLRWTKIPGLPKTVCRRILRLAFGSEASLYPLL